MSILPLYLIEIILALTALVSVGLIAFRKPLPFVRWFFPALALITIALFLLKGSSLWIYDHFTSKTLFKHMCIFVILSISAIAECARQCRENPESFVFIVLSVLGLVTMVSAKHFLTLYVGIELATFPVLAWIAIRRENGLALEGALKLFVLSAIASGVFLFGVALHYCQMGSLDYWVFLNLNEANFMPPVRPFLNDVPLISRVGFSFILVSLLFKVGLVPFHFWLPDVYQGSTMRQVAFMSTAMKVAAFAVLANIFREFLMVDFTSLALLSIVVGFFGALYQKNIKRLLAYSGIGHAGFIVLGIDTNFFAFGYLIGYVFSLMIVWQVLISLRRESDYEIELCSDLKGLGKRHPYTAAFLTLALLSMMGMPPLPVFWGKLIVLGLLVSKQMIWLAVLCMLMSVVAAYYTLRLIYYMYFCEDEKSLQQEDRSTKVKIGNLK